MTIREKNKEKLLHDNTLRNKLQEIQEDKKVIVIYKGDTVAVNFPKFLLTKSSRVFMSLMNKPIKDEVKGRSIYLII